MTPRVVRAAVTGAFFAAGALFFSSPFFSSFFFPHALVFFAGDADALASKTSASRTIPSPHTSSPLPSLPSPLSAKFSMHRFMLAKTKFPSWI